MSKMKRLRETFDKEAAAISDILATLDSLRDWNGGVRVLLFVLSRYWENGWRAAMKAHGSKLENDGR
jgi:hypothetical protein